MRKNGGNFQHRSNFRTPLLRRLATGLIYCQIKCHLFYLHRRTNFIFIVSTCPTPSHHIEEISELTVAKSVKTFISGDLSTQLQRQGIAVFWIDTYIDLIGLKVSSANSFNYVPLSDSDSYLLNTWFFNFDRIIRKDHVW